MIKISRILGIVLIVPLLCLTLVACHHSALDVTITWPYDGMRLYATPAPVRGTVSDPSAEVTINSTPVVVAENGYFVGSVDLAKGENTITVVAILEEQEASKSITIIYQPAK